MSLNVVNLEGNFTNDPGIKYTPNGTAVLEFSLAQNQRGKRGGEWTEVTNYFDCQAWGITAEKITEFFIKGKPIIVEGNLVQDTWEDKDGNRRSKIRIRVEKFHFVERNSKKKQNPQDEQQEQSVGANTTTDEVGTEDIPF